MTDVSAGRRAGLRELFGHVFQQRRTLLVIVILSLISSAASLAQPLLIGEVIERVGAAEPLEWRPWLLGALVVGGALLGGVLQYLIQRTAEGAIRSSRRRLVDHVLRLPIPQVDRRRIGDLVSRVSNDTTVVRNMLSQGFIESIAGVFTLAGATVAMMLIDPVLLAIALGVALVAVIAVVSVTTHIERASLGLQNAVGALASSTDRALRAIRTVRAANATEAEADRVKRDADAAWRVGVRVARITALVSPISSVATQGSFLVVLGVGGLRVASGQLTVAELVSFILFLFLLITPLGMIFGTVSGIGEALGGITRINEILSLPMEGDNVVDGPTAELAPGVPMGLEFDGVTFTYRSEETDDAGDGRAATLQGVSFHVAPGQRVAVVGPSGAGKSTLLHLVARFYDPDDGVIRFGGVDVARLTRSAVRSRISYVEQNAPAIAGTLRDNLTVGASHAADADLYEVLRQLDLIEVVDRSPLGLDTEIGEGGVLLSGGERQRLAVARAILARPSLLLLDESTANLDGVNEERVRDIVDRAVGGCTVVVVAHRLATVLSSDLIVVLDRGAVVDSGTHEVLMQTSDLYRDLSRNQLVPV